MSEKARQQFEAARKQMLDAQRVCHWCKQRFENSAELVAHITVWHPEPKEQANDSYASEAERRRVRASRLVRVDEEVLVRIAARAGETTINQGLRKLLGLDCKHEFYAVDPGTEEVLRCAQCDYLKLREPRT